MNNTLFRIGSQNGWATSQAFLGKPLEQETFYALRAARRDPYTSLHNGLLSSHYEYEIALLPEMSAELLYLMARAKMGKTPKPMTRVGRILESQSRNDRIYVLFEHGSLKMRIKVKERPKQNEVADFDLMVVDVE